MVPSTTIPKAAQAAATQFRPPPLVRRSPQALQRIARAATPQHLLEPDMTAIPNSIEARDIASVLHPATNFKALNADGPLVITEGKGVFVKDNHGKEYIEGLAGLWCTSLGHGVKELAETARAQMENVAFSHMFGGRSHAPAIELAEKLKEWSPLDTGKVFFGCSGSDANDTQVKLIRYYNNAVGRPEKKKIISRKKAYHGVTLASASLTGLPVNHAHFDLPFQRSPIGPPQSCTITVTRSVATASSCRATRSLSRS